ncbi:MAG TPA: LamG domain-containing protein [Vicinamibacterales bacterium]|nr:LamG domain-containing protein [Vicinamibacterales bacterium]
MNESSARRAYGRRILAVAGAAVIVAPLVASQATTVDLSHETIGKPPSMFEIVMGFWSVVQDGSDKVIKVDGAAWKATQDTPTQLLLESARRVYGTTNEELMDNAKQFTVYPVAVLKTVPSFANGTISVKFKTISGNADRASGILFNLKPNGDWLSLRYNEMEHNVVLWEFHNGVRRSVIRPHHQLLTDPADHDKWHELKLSVDGANIKGYLDGADVLEWTLGSQPGPGRGGRTPNADLYPANNPVLRPPVDGKVGLWAKTDTTSYFKDYVVTPAVK